jgi:magnesium-protoporphyrin O-methyltransferase
VDQSSYSLRRSQLETYFDRTALEAWSRLTSDAPVSRIRATVRAGREAMRATILDYLPSDLTGCRVLDAGCGTGALAVEAARRGANVVAVDLSPRLVALAEDRLPSDLRGRVRFATGDMLNDRLGAFDHVVAMDSLIHYRAPDMANVVTQLARRTRRSIIFTYAPRTAMLTLMHAVGQLFPRGDRSPAIEPVSPAVIRRLVDAGVASCWPAPSLASPKPGPTSNLGRSKRIASGFYISEALEVLIA